MATLCYYTAIVISVALLSAIATIGNSDQPIARVRCYYVKLNYNRWCAQPICDELKMFSFSVNSVNISLPRSTDTLGPSLMNVISRSPIKHSLK